MSARTDIVPRAHDALNRGDAEGSSSYVRFDMSDRVFNPEVYSGDDGIRRFMAEVHEVWETFTREPTEVKETDDVVLALVHSVGTVAGAGHRSPQRHAPAYPGGNAARIDLLPRSAKATDCSAMCRRASAAPRTHARAAA
jgi:hypothetical protein